MDSKPEISVIIAAYNAEKYIEKSLLSIINQNFSNIEILIVNDASTDNTLSILKKYAMLDSRITIINNSTNIYATKSRNTALKIAIGKYIAIQDADDIAYQDRLKIQYEYLERHPKVFLVGSGAINIDENGKVLSRFYPILSSFLIRKAFRYKNAIYHPTAMFRNTKQLFYREKIYYCEDYDFCLFLISCGKKIANIFRPLISYRILNTSVTRSKRLQQDLFADKAREFYMQRLKNGYDNYEKFSADEILLTTFDSEVPLVMKKVIKILFNNRNYKDVESKCHLYISKYGHSIIVDLYLLFSIIMGRLR